MKTVEGIYASATIFTDEVEDYAVAQIQQLCNHPAFAGSKIRIMPDVHPGKVGTIGFTAIVGDKIMPNVVGIDIGCGMTMAKLKQKKIEFQKLDTVIRECVPSGFQVRRKPHRYREHIDLSQLCCGKYINRDKAFVSLGTLGGGNHFIEVDRDEDGFLYVVIHTGSRRLGKEMTEYYLKEGQKYLKNQGIQTAYELTWLEDELMDDYMHDVQVVQEFAQINREAILDELVRGMKWKIEETYSTGHNYIDTTDGNVIVRKGAISARKGERVIIPVNMRDGVLLGTGLGKEEWNYSAPHGAGRIMKREEVRQKFTVSQFKTEMKGIYCSCLGKDTLDESPFAYRRIEMLQENIRETVKIDKILKPVYNFKAGGREE